MIKKYYRYDYAESVGGATVNPEYGKPRFFLKVSWDKEGEKEMILWHKRLNGMSSKESKDFVQSRNDIEMGFEHFSQWEQEINIFRKNFSSHVTIKFWCEEEIIGEKDYTSVAF